MQHNFLRPIVLITKCSKCTLNSVMDNIQTSNICHIFLVRPTYILKIQLNNEILMTSVLLASL